MQEGGEGCLECCYGNFQIELQLIVAESLLFSSKTIDLNAELVLRRS